MPTGRRAAVYALHTRLRRYKVDPFVITRPARCVDVGHVGVKLSRRSFIDVCDIYLPLVEVASIIRDSFSCRGPRRAAAPIAQIGDPYEITAILITDPDSAHAVAFGNKSNLISVW